MNNVPSDKLKTNQRKNMEHFYGPSLKMTSGNYFHFNSVLNNDEIILLTNEVKNIKGKPVLMLSKKTGIYLKEWQIRKVCNYQKGINCYAVKLNRNFFNPYSFSINFEEVQNNFNTFDDICECVKEQNQENLSIREGWIK